MSPSSARQASAKSPTTPRPRIRLTPEQRLAQILTEATRLVGEHGFYGVALQDVADAVGLSQPGLLHYVRNKEGLLQLLVEQAYDKRFDPADFIKTGAPEAVHPEGASFPAYCRYLVTNNARDPQLIKLYMVLGAEAASEGHPAHDYFSTRPDDVWALYSQTRWRVPESVGGFETMRGLVEMCLEAMDGIQVRMFRNPPIDLPTEWAKFEAVLFPSPEWDGFR